MNKIQVPQLKIALLAEELLSLREGFVTFDWVIISQKRY